MLHSIIKPNSYAKDMTPMRQSITLSRQNSFTNHFPDNIGSQTSNNLHNNVRSRANSEYSENRRLSATQHKYPGTAEYDIKDLGSEYDYDKRSMKNEDLRSQAGMQDNQRRKAQQLLNSIRGACDDVVNECQKIVRSQHSIIKNMMNMQATDNVLKVAKYLAEQRPDTLQYSHDKDIELGLNFILNINDEKISQKDVELEKLQRRLSIKEKENNELNKKYMEMLESNIHRAKEDVEVNERWRRKYDIQSRLIDKLFNSYRRNSDLNSLFTEIFQLRSAFQEKGPMALNLNISVVESIDEPVIESGRKSHYRHKITEQNYSEAGYALPQDDYELVNHQQVYGSSISQTYESYLPKLKQKSSLLYDEQGVRSQVGDDDIVDQQLVASYSNPLLKDTEQSKVVLTEAVEKIQPASEVREFSKQFQLVSRVYEIIIQQQKIELSEASTQTQEKDYVEKQIQVGPLVTTRSSSTVQSISVLVNSQDQSVQTEKVIQDEATIKTETPSKSYNRVFESPIIMTIGKSDSADITKSKATHQVTSLKLFKENYKMTIEIMNAFWKILAKAARKSDQMPAHLHPQRMKEDFNQFIDWFNALYMGLYKSVGLEDQAKFQETKKQFFLGSLDKIKVLVTNLVESAKTLGLF